MANRYAAVYAMAKKADINKEDLHKLAFSMTQKKSLTELDDCELAAVTERLRVLKNSKEHGQKNRNFTLGGNPVTVKQRKKIYMLMKTMDWDIKRVSGLARKLFDSDAVEWLSHEQCSDLIEALKDISARRDQSQEAQHE